MAPRLAPLQPCRADETGGGANLQSPLPERDAIGNERSVPPAEHSVPVGWCDSEQHLDWIPCTGLYNFRAGLRRGSLRLEPAIADEPPLLSMGSLRSLRLIPFFPNSVPPCLRGENAASRPETSAKSPKPGRIRVFRVIRGYTLPVADAESSRLVNCSCPTRKMGVYP